MTGTELADRKSIINAVANEVRAELARRRMSHQEAARRLGWKPAYIGRRMTGDTALDAADLQQLAALLDVPITAFFPTPDHGAGAQLVNVHYLTDPSLTCRNGRRWRQPRNFEHSRLLLFEISPSGRGDLLAA